MASSSQYRIWWLNPGWVFPFALIPWSLAACFLTNEQYTLYWKSGRFFDAGDLAFVGACVVTFLIGGAFANILSAGPVNTDWGKFSDKELRFLLRLFQVGAALTILAYLIWFGIAIRGGMTLTMLWEILKGESGTAYETRALLTTLPGITTATQFAMAVFIIGTILFFNGKASKVTGWMAIILVLAILRNFLHNERLALTEIAAPTICLVAFYCRQRFRRYLHGFSSVIWPVIAVVIFYLLFTGSEYGRSWATFYRDEGVYNSVWEFSAFRVLGYYVTALNNGSLFYHIGGINDLPEATFQWFWKFPVIGSKAHAMLDPHQKESVYTLLNSDANPEFNNISLPFDIALDWGQYFAPLFFLLTGFVIFYFYRRFVRGNTAGLLIYPLFYTGLLEAARESYWTTSRCFPSWLLLFLAIYGIRRIQKKHQRTQRSQELAAQAPESFSSSSEKSKVII